MPGGVAGLSRSALLAHDATVLPSIHAADPDDACLLALAAEQRAELVSGDAHLFELCDDPIQGLGEALRGHAQRGRLTPRVFRGPRRMADVSLGGTDEAHPRPHRPMATTAADGWRRTLAMSVGPNAVTNKRGGRAVWMDVASHAGARQTKSEETS